MRNPLDPLGTGTSYPPGRSILVHDLQYEPSNRLALLHLHRGHVACQLPT